MSIASKIRDKANSISYLAAALVDKRLFKNEEKYRTYHHYLADKITYEYVPLFDFLLINHEWAKILPKDIDCVIGIPRLGLISGTMAATYLGKRLTTPDLMLLKKDLKGEEIKFPLSKILLVDDSITRGNTIMKVKASLQEEMPNTEIILAAPFVSPALAKTIKYKIAVKEFMVFESDLADNPNGEVAVDIDGVLCRNPTEEDTKDDVALERFYQNAVSLFSPNYRIKIIASARREKFRKVTEEWLKQNNISYEYLLLKSDEKEGVDVKINAVRKFKPFFFLESNKAEAQKIFKETGCRVICFENNYLYGGKNDRLIKSSIPMD